MYTVERALLNIPDICPGGTENIPDYHER